MRGLILLVLLPLVAHAAGEGSWQASGMGATLSNRGGRCLIASAGSVAAG